MKLNKQSTVPVLLIDDEESWLHSFTITLQSAGIHSVVTCSDSRNALSLMQESSIGLVVLDLTMPHISGQELLGKIHETHPDIPVIVVTGVNDIQTAVDCMKLGALDYFVKTVEADRLINGIVRAVEFQQLKRENSRLKERFLDDHLEHPEAFDGITTESMKIRSVFQYLEAIAPSSEPVLITGETGVGKELFAKAVHTLSGRAGEFVAVNVAGLDEQAFSDTLFGHKKGAFTGADTTRQGLIEKAQGGTLFLDEIGDLALELQVKLLRLLQEHEYFPLGSDVSKKTDARFVVATNHDIAALTASGVFRNDLYYRLTTHQVHIPPLRERKEDIPVLLKLFLGEVSEQLAKNVPTVPKELYTLLSLYSYPGNIREFKAMVHEAVTHHQGGIMSMDSFKKHIHALGTLPEVSESHESADSGVTFSDSLPNLKEMDDLLIDEALARTEGNQALAAEILGISRQALNKRVKQREG